MSNIYGTQGIDALFGTEKNDNVVAYAGNDLLYGLGGSDVLNGGHGNDYLDGGDGNDRLIGGAGNDTLVGGQGTDTYEFARGFGQDTIQNNLFIPFPEGTPIDSKKLAAGASGPDVIAFNNSILSSDVTLVRQWDDLLIQVNDSDDAVRVSGYFLDATQSGRYISNIQFANGTTWDADFINKAVLTATPQDDNLFGSSGNDTIDGLEGNDSIFGFNGQDVLRGGKGTDLLWGGQGKDTLRGDAGDDSLSGEEGNDRLLGGQGNDWLSGGEGSDLLDGGTGNDSLSGEFGQDTYVFNVGSGQDTIYNYDYGNNTSDNGDVVQFGRGISAENTTVTREGTDLLVRFEGLEDSLRVSNYFMNDATESYAVSAFQFKDETVWDVATIKNMVQQPTAQNDTIYGYSGNDVLHGGNGSDSLIGELGNDTLRGEAGNDWLDGGEGHDRLNGGTGQDSLSGGAGNDLLRAGQGSDWLSGGAGNDLLYGEGGDDFMMGDEGLDVYAFGRGAGQDTIMNYDADNDTASNGDTVQFGTSVSTSNVVLSREWDDLLVALNNSSDTLRISAYFNNDGQNSYTVENLQFTDGTVWKYDDVVGQLPVVIAPPSEGPIEVQPSAAVAGLVQQTDVLVASLAAMPAIDGGGSSVLSKGVSLSELSHLTIPA